MNSETLSIGPSIFERHDFLIRSMATFGLLLIGLSWKLWTPQTVFPQVPVVGWLVSAPAWMDWAALSGMIAGLAGTSVTHSRSSLMQKRWAALFVVSAVISILLDQHRFQPWLYQLLILVLFFQTMARDQFLRACGWLLASIYIFSAISKFDYQFVHSMVDDFLSVFNQLGLRIDQDAGQQRAAGLVMASGELVAGIFLLIPYALFRGMGVVLAISMHLCLLFLLGPLGLGHSSPVLIWNIAFILLLILLYVPLPSKLFSDVAKPLASDSDGSHDNWRGQVFLAFVMLFPATSFVGIADHWASWELYSPRSSRVLLYCWPLKQNDSVDLNRWSLDELGVPVYPQSRFQLGCALAIESQLKDDRVAIRYSIQSVSNRWGGRRDSITGNSNSAPPNRLQDHGERFWLNVRPRHRFRLQDVNELPRNFYGESEQMGG